MAITQIINAREKGEMDLKNLIKQCNNILIAASRDLAVFTQHNIRANDIVSLSQKLESLQQIFERGAVSYEDRVKMRTFCRELLLGIGKICHKAHELAEQPLRHSVYLGFRRRFDEWWLKWATGPYG